ncbi:MAG: hypothetical protein E7Z65_06345 [Thermoplasmata archaeon]|nr:hypothetical protein [Thermoplasmata archaeon]
MMIAKVIVPKGEYSGIVEMIEPPVGLIGRYEAREIHIDYEGHVIGFKATLFVNPPEGQEGETRVFETEVTSRFDLLEYNEELLS